MITPQQEVYYEKLRSARREAYRRDNRQTLVYPDLIFIGDSITEWFPIEEKLQPRKTWLNRGIAASNSQHIVDHLDAHLVGNVASHIILLLGTNDIGYNLPLQQTLANLTTLIEEVEAGYPFATLYLLELLPVNEAEQYREAVDNRTNAQLAQLNQAYAQLADAYPQVQLVPTYARFLNHQGQLAEHLTKDGLHLSDAGYDCFADIIRPLLD